MSIQNNLLLKVVLWNNTIGLMKWDDEKGVAIFQFTDEYLRSPWEISPVARNKRNTQGRAFYGSSKDGYCGLPEFIADSLPDDWGNQLFDEWLKMKEIPASRANPLVKLSFIGERSMGALEFVPAYDTDSEDNKIDINQLHSLSKKILHERESLSLSRDEKRTLKKLILLGTSAGGKHAKGLIAINDKTGEIRSGQIHLSPEFKHYIIKFKEDENVPTSEVEMAYHDMAINAKIDMMPSKLMNVEGVNHFITERFDRKNGEKIFSQTLFAVAPSADDYMKIFWLSNTLKLTQYEKEQLFRRMVFNVFAGITDDHNKNFSFIMEKDGKWSLSPAYDLIFTANIWENPSASIHSMGVAGKHSNITYNDLKELGKDFEIANAEIIISETARTVQKFPDFCSKYNIEMKWVKTISDVLNSFLPQGYQILIQQKQKNTNATTRQKTDADKKRNGPHL